MVIVLVLLVMCAFAVVSVLLDEARHRDKHRRLKEGATYLTNTGRELYVPEEWKDAA